MKKLSKFIFGTVSLATLACGAYYVYKNLINKDSSDEFDDFEDEFEDFDTDEDYEDITIPKDTREYVSINITSDNNDAATNVESHSEETDLGSEADVLLSEAIDLQSEAAALVSEAIVLESEADDLVSEAADIESKETL